MKWIFKIVGILVALGMFAADMAVSIAGNHRLD